MINVNYGSLQGDANLLINGDIVSMIDAGYQREAEVAVVPYLRRLGITTIHHFFVSHPHRDHYEGMEAIGKAGIRIRNIYYSMPPGDTYDCCYNRTHFLSYLTAARQRGAALHEISAGWKLDYPNGARIEVLHAHKNASFNNKIVDVNDMSLVMMWHVKGYRVLFTGDLNANIGSYLASDSRMKADILKVPHHGGYGIAPRAFFERVNPKLNMVPGPTWVWVGQRGKLARDYSVSSQIKYCVNGINGTVVLKFDKGVNIWSQQPAHHCPNGDAGITPATVAITVINQFLLSD